MDRVQQAFWSVWECDSSLEFDRRRVYRHRTSSLVHDDDVASLSTSSSWSSFRRRCSTRTDHLCQLIASLNHRRLSLLCSFAIHQAPPTCAIHFAHTLIMRYSRGCISTLDRLFCSYFQNTDLPKMSMQRLRDGAIRIICGPANCKARHLLSESLSVRLSACLAHSWVMPKRFRASKYTPRRTTERCFSIFPFTYAAKVVFFDCRV